MKYGSAVAKSILAGEENRKTETPAVNESYMGILIKREHTSVVAALSISREYISTLQEEVACGTVWVFLMKSETKSVLATSRASDSSPKYFEKMLYSSESISSFFVVSFGFFERISVIARKFVYDFIKVLTERMKRTKQPTKQ